MKPYVKFSLILGISFILAGCQLNNKKPLPFPASENQVVSLEKVPAELLEKSGVNQPADVALAYQLTGDNQVLNVTEERYENGQRVARGLLLNLTQIDTKGYLALGVEELNAKEDTATKDYQLTLKVVGTAERQGEVRWQVNAKEQVNPLVDYVITLPQEPLDVTLEQAIFAVKFSPTEKPTPLSVDFLKAPEDHLAEVGETETVYLFRSHFSEK